MVVGTRVIRPHVAGSYRHRREHPEHSHCRGHVPSHAARETHSSRRARPFSPLAHRARRHRRPGPTPTQSTRLVPSPTRRPARAPNAKTPPDGYGVGCSSRGLRAVRGRGNAPSWLAPRRCGEAQEVVSLKSPKARTVRVPEGDAAMSCEVRNHPRGIWRLFPHMISPEFFPEATSYSFLQPEFLSKPVNLIENTTSRVSVCLLRCEETTAARRGAPLPSGAD